MDESSIDESLFTSASGRRSPGIKRNKQRPKRAQPTPPATIALPAKPRDDEDESVEDYSNHPKPFDEPHMDDVPSDVSCGVDEPLVEPTAPDQSLSRNSTVLTPPDGERQPLMEVMIPSPAKTPKQTSMTAKTPTVDIKSTTPETQTSPFSEQGDFMQAYSHSGPEIDADDVPTRLFDANDDDAAFLEEGMASSYQKPIESKDDGDLTMSEDDESKEPTTPRSHRRCFLFCFLISLLMIVAAAGISVYMFVFQNGTRKANAVVGPPTLTPSAAPSMEPTAPTASPAPSLAPSASAVPSDAPSTMPSQAPTDRPSLSPSVSPSDFPSTSPTLSPTRDFTALLTEYMFANYGVNFQNPATDMAVEWLNLESQRLIGGGQMDMSPKLAQRFALLTLEFTAMDIASQQQESTQDTAPEVLEDGVNITDEDANTTTPDTDSSGFFGSALTRQSNLPITMDSQFLVPECNWTGIECNEDGYVKTVKWPYRDYRGAIPQEIRILSNLTHLDLSNNYLKSRIPEEVYYLTNLERLYLFKNFFTGTISTRIGDLDKITHFHLSHNELTGSIPTELKSGNNGIRPLKYFNVYSNQLTGTIPQNLRLRQVKYFDLGRNQLTGRLPQDIGQAFVELRSFHLDHNDFRGTLPREYNTVGNGRLASFTINHNRLTGYVSGDRQLYNNLLQYTLHENQFSGLDSENCRMEIPYGEMVEFKADCDICRCNGWFNLCGRWCD